MQGKSLVTFIEKTDPRRLARCFISPFYKYPREHRVCRHKGVTTDRYKLIRFYGYDVLNSEESELYTCSTLESARSH